MVHRNRSRRNPGLDPWVFSFSKGKSASEAKKEQEVLPTLLPNLSILPHNDSTAGFSQVSLGFYPEIGGGGL
jgi:hypothetical protein